MHMCVTPVDVIPGVNRDSLQCNTRATPSTLMNAPGRTHTPAPLNCHYFHGDSRSRSASLKSGPSRGSSPPDYLKEAIAM